MRFIAGPAATVTALASLKGSGNIISTGSFPECATELNLTKYLQPTILVLGSESTRDLATLQSLNLVKER